MRFQHSRASAFRALLASLVDKTACRAGRSAYLDLVLLALRRSVGIEAAALANREEEVVVFTIQRNKRSFLCMFAFGLEGEWNFLSAADDLERWVRHVDGEQVAPE